MIRSRTNFSPDSATPHSADPAWTAPASRRIFLKQAMSAAAGLSLGWPRVQAKEERAGLTHAAAPKRILILGAGPAGLVAGYELKKAGHSVTILEATARPGGRVRTLREPFADGIIAEAGAGRFPPHHQLTWHYIREFGLETAPFYPTAGSDIYLLGGARLVAARGQDPEMQAVPLPLTREERQLGFSGLYQRHIGDPSAPFGAGYVGEVAPDVRALGDVGFYDYLRGRGLSDAAARYLCLGFEEDSALDFIRDAAGHNVPVMHKIVGGNDRLPFAFAQRLREEIRYGSPVTRIRAGDGKVAVTVRRAGGVSEEHVGDRLICTLPFSVLREVEIGAPLSTAKRRAIKEMYYGHVTRLFAQMRRKFWAEEGRSGFGYFDQPMELWHPTHDAAGPRGLLLGYTYERLARKYEKLGPAARTERFVELLENVHPGARAHFETGASWSWHDQPFQKGAFLVARAGDFARFYEPSSAIEGRLHFAGEHTSPWPGWVQGALHSGLRAAREVNASNS